MEPAVFQPYIKNYWSLAIRREKGLEFFAVLLLLLLLLFRALTSVLRIDLHGHENRNRETSEKIL